MREKLELISENEKLNATKALGSPHSSFVPPKIACEEQKQRGDEFNNTAGAVNQKIIYEDIQEENSNSTAIKKRVGQAERKEKHSK